MQAALRLSERGLFVYSRLTTHHSLLGRHVQSRGQQRLDKLRVGAVVEPHDAFLAAGGHDRAVRADGDGVEEVGAAAEIPRVAAVVDVPEAHLRVAAARCELRRLADEYQPRGLLPLGLT